jgi:hypothetical protein
VRSCFGVDGDGSKSCDRWWNAALLNSPQVNLDHTNIAHLRRGHAINERGNSLLNMPKIPTAPFLAVWPAEEGKGGMRRAPEH